MPKRTSTVQSQSRAITKKPRRNTDEENEENNYDLDIAENTTLSQLSQPSSQSLVLIEPMVGVIKRVTLTNFMCHSKLDVPLGSHVNFIVGRNGSGKSAIITALVVGLGGKASATNRGTAVKRFVKTGKRSASVEVVLNNTGRDAYRPAIYGDKIIVKRKFTAEGSSSYSLCGASGNLVSERRDELSRITDHMNIQVDNPISILNQDTSRNFLNSKSSADKFKFFMRATQLEQMNQDYESIHKLQETTKQIIFSKEQTLPEMKDEVIVWENKFKNLTALSDLKEKVQKLKRENVWAIVAEKERSLAPLEKSLHGEVGSFSKCENKVQDVKAALAESEERYKEAEKKLIECGQEVKQLEATLQQRKKLVQDAKQELAPILQAIKANETEYKGLKRECQQCQERIQELKETASSDFESIRQEREEKIAQLQENLERLECTAKVSEQDREQHRSAITKYKTDLVQLDTQINRLNARQREVRKTITNLEGAKQNKLIRFGKWVPVIRKEIDSCRKFHQKPRGPLGDCFELEDYDWSLAVEVCLKGLVNTYTCHDSHDEQLLMQIFEKSGCPKTKRPTVIVSKFLNTVHNVSKNKVRTDRYVCLMDIIKCDDPVVMNTLIDQRSIENVLLFKKEEEARHVMINNVPVNAKECFTVDGYQMLINPTFRQYATDLKAAKFIMASPEQRLQEYTGQLQDLLQQVKAEENQRNSLRKTMERDETEEKRCQTNLNKLNREINQIRFDIEELQNAEDPQPVDVTPLEEEIAAANENMEKLSAARNTLMEEKESKEVIYNEAKEHYSVLEAEIREKSDVGIPLQEEMSTAQKNVDIKKNEVRHYTARLKEQEKKIQEITKQIDECKDDVAANVEKALQVCERIDTRRTANSVENEIVQIQKRIDEEEQTQGSEEEIVSTYNNKKTSYKRVKKEVAQQKSYLMLLDEMMVRRKERYREMRRFLATRIKDCFIQQMQQRSYTGKMNFNFDSETLDIVVKTSQNTSNDSCAKDLKSLSGGERSFSTVCFILSLWEAMESPFRCLDEFDVFMDMVNRSISMDMMLEAADMHKDLQFVFLTPQDMSSLRRIRNVKIFRMPDPERTVNQSSLEFTLSSQY